jgi:hypothetical protein
MGDGHQPVFISKPELSISSIFYVLSLAVSSPRMKIPVLGQYPLCDLAWQASEWEKAAPSQQTCYITPVVLFSGGAFSHGLWSSGTSPAQMHVLHS